MLAVVPCACPYAPYELEPVEELPFCRKGPGQFIVDRLGVSALFDTLEAVGVAS